MNVLVTGSNGFVGRHLCVFLRRHGIDVLPFSRTRRDGSRGVSGVCDEIDKLLGNVDAVVHAAGAAHQSGRRAEEQKRAFHEGNYEFTKCLAEKLVGTDVKCMIHISSIAAAGHTRFSKGAGLSEEDAVEPNSEYGLSKRRCEPAVEGLRDWGILGVNLRPPLIYGSGAKGNWPKLIGLADSRLPLPFASINNRRSFLGIDNLGELVLAVLLRAEQPGLSGTYHVADSDVVSLEEVVAHMRKKLGRPLGMFKFPGGILKLGFKMLGRESMSDGLFADLILDSARVRKAFSWQPSIGTLEGMMSSLDGKLPDNEIDIR